MIDALTLEQQALLPVVRDEWIAAALSGKGPRITVEQAREQARWIYGLSKMKLPQIVVVDSPMACQVATNLLSVRDSVGDSVGDSVRTSVWDSVWDSVGDSVWDSVGDSVRTSVWESVWDSVGDSKMEWRSFSLCGICYDSGWAAFYDYFDRIGVKMKCENWPKLKAFLLSGIWDCILSQDYAIICRLPVEVCKDELGRLHSQSGPAVRWADGYANYAIHGVRFDDPTPILHPETITPERVLGESNVEVRRALIDLMGERFVREANFELVHADTERPVTPCHVCLGLRPTCEACGSTGVFRPENYRRLLLKRMADDEDMVFLEVVCPSTGKQVLLRVPPGTSSCHQAAAWVAGFDDPSNYRPLVEA